MNYYIGEDFTVQFNAGTDITGGSTSVKYLDPEGNTTTVAGTITDAANGIFSAEFGPASNAITLAGEYKFWSVLTLAGKVSISAPTLVYILQEGRLK